MSLMIWRRLWQCLNSNVKKSAFVFFVAISVFSLVSQSKTCSTETIYRYRAAVIDKPKLR